jgi:hypothetical protein
MNSTGIFARIIGYIRALGIIGNLLTILGLLPTLVDIFSPMLNIQINISPIFSLVWFIVAFIIANFRIYSSFEETNIELISKSFDITLERVVSENPNELTVNSEIVLTLHTQVDLLNHIQRRTYPKIEVTSVKSEWQLKGKPNACIVRVDRRTPTIDGTVSDNPFYMEAGEIDTDSHVGAVLKFIIPDQTKVMEYFGSLKTLQIKISVVQTGHKSSTITYTYDTGNIHKQFESQLISRAQHLQNKDIVPSQMAKILKPYYSVVRNKK